MQFDIVIKNLGKIREANVKIRPFTVIAGKNSSGKSFITKSLYSFFSTVNVDHVSLKTFSRIENIKQISNYLIEKTASLSQHEKYLFERILECTENLQNEVEKVFGCNTLSNQILKTHLLKESILELENEFKNLFNEISEKQKFISVKNEFQIFHSLILELKQIVTSPNACLVDEVNKGFIDSLKENFQVPLLSELKNNRLPNEKTISFNFDKLGSVNIIGENLSFKLNNSNGVDAIQQLHNVVYLESPIYWKLKNALENSELSRTLFRYRSHDRKAMLSGVPKYFYDLVKLISSQAKDIQIINLYDDINSEIGGEIVISNSGELSFVEKGLTTPISLHNTALGVTNLGIISLLLKKGILSKGSFLFIDEPEAHLHPSWQKTMVDTLYALSQHGVNVVIASHSIDMMKCIENIMEKSPEEDLEAHFGINQLSVDGESIENGCHPLRKIALIQEDLGQSFYDMFME
ncbi:MAG: AAA family ATPase [Methylococcales bacterium]|nr:AAA family ATPase [Methylococcales bacterium]